MIERLVKTLMKEESHVAQGRWLLSWSRSDAQGTGTWLGCRLGKTPLTLRTIKSHSQPATRLGPGLKAT